MQMVASTTILYTYEFDNAATLSLEQQYSIDTELMQHYIAHSDRRA